MAVPAPPGSSLLIVEATSPGLALPGVPTIESTMPDTPGMLAPPAANAPFVASSSPTLPPPPTTTYEMPTAGAPPIALIVVVVVAGGLVLGIVLWGIFYGSRASG
jgi:hypothetical protein